MDASILLASLLGPLFLLIGIGMLLNQQHYRSMLASFLKDSGLYYFSGALALVAGIAMVLFHNLWVADWRLVITLIGWLSIVKGAVRLLLPRAGIGLAESLTASRGPLLGFAALSIVLGVWLSFEGFGAAAAV